MTTFLEFMTRNPPTPIYVPPPAPTISDRVAAIQAHREGRAKLSRRLEALTDEINSATADLNREQERIREALAGLSSSEGHLSEVSAARRAAEPARGRLEGLKGEKARLESGIAHLDPDAQERELLRLFWESVLLEVEASLKAQIGDLLARLWAIRSAALGGHYEDWFGTLIPRPTEELLARIRGEVLRDLEVDL